MRARRAAIWSVAWLAGFAMPAEAQLAPPLLIGIDTRGSDTAAFAVAATVHAPVTGLRLRFDQAVLAVAADFRLLRAADGAMPQTIGCGVPPASGDVELDGLILDYDASEFRIDLAVAPQGLPAGRYRLIACDSLHGLLGSAFDGDGDGLPGGDAIRDFAIATTPVLDNPGFTIDDDGWTVGNLSSGSLAAEWSALDADGDAGSGSLRITGSGGAVAILGNSACAHVEDVAAGRAFAAELYLRYRVLAGEARIVVTAINGFAGDMGETACAGPHVAREFVIESGTPGTEFLTFRSDRLWLPGMPLAELRIRILSRSGEFDVLIDDVGFGFDPEPVFAARFERGERP
jgi:hypothetical protein